MRSIVFGLIILSALFSCKKEGNYRTNAELRIFNSTPFAFDTCIVDAAGSLSDNGGPAAFDYGHVAMDAKTNYHTFKILYRYAWMKISMNNKTYYLKPYDYIGEEPVKRGKYTYKINYNALTDWISIEFIAD